MKNSRTFRVIATRLGEKATTGDFPQRSRLRSCLSTFPALFELLRIAVHAAISLNIPDNAPQLHRDYPTFPSTAPYGNLLRHGYSSIRARPGSGPVRRDSSCA